MNKFDFKLSIRIFFISIILLFIEIGVYWTMGISAQAGSGEEIRIFFDIFLFIIVFTLSIGTFSLFLMLFNKFYAFCPSFNQLIILSLVMGAILFYFL
jgi:hypothetical protein